MITSRRSFITGLSALIAAPAIVKASSLMPIKATPIICGEIVPGEYLYFIDGVVVQPNQFILQGQLMSPDGKFIMDLSKNMVTFKI